MAETRLFQACEQIVTELKAISRPGGFHFDVHPDAVSLNPQDRITALMGTSLSPYLVLEVPGFDQTYSSSSYAKQEVDVSIAAGINVSPTDPRARLQEWTWVVADVEKAIAREPTLNGHCADAKVVNARMGAMAEGGRVFGLIDVVLLIHHPYGEA